MEQAIKQLHEFFQGKLEGKILSSKEKEIEKDKFLVEQTFQFVYYKNQELEYYRELMVTLKNVCEKTLEAIDSVTSEQ